MQKAVGREKEMDGRHHGDRDQDCRFPGSNFLLAASCLLPSFLYVFVSLWLDLCLGGKP